MSAEENKALARRSWEAVDNPDIIDEVYASDLVWHEPDRDIHGTEEAKQYVSAYKSAFPDLQVSVEDVLAEGDKVITRYTISGTHQGEIEEFGAPTGRQVALKGITIHRIEDGKIVEEWEQYDNLGLLQQLGLAPEVPSEGPVSGVSDTVGGVTDTLRGTTDRLLGGGGEEKQR